jgi:hypothetical protein
MLPAGLGSSFTDEECDYSTYLLPCSQTLPSLAVCANRPHTVLCSRQVLALLPLPLLQDAGNCCW